MKKLYYIFPAALISFAVISCGGGSSDDIDYDDYDTDVEEVDDTPIETTFDEILEGDMPDYSTVIFEAFVGQLPITMYFSEGELSLDFYKRRNQVEGPHMNTDIREGSSRNSAEPLPEEYSQEDLRIHTENGDIAVVGDYVRITGEFTEASDPNYQYIDIEKIELLDYAFDESIFEEATALTDEVMNNEDYDQGYTFIEGSLSLSSYVSAFDGCYVVQIDQNMNQYLTSVYIRVGDGASTMNLLPDGFGDADFILRDFNGDEFNGNTNVRLYGTFDQLSGEGSGIFTAEEIMIL